MVETTHDQIQTMVLAEKLAQTLKGGEIIALSGDLGSGKTTFTKGLAEALKVEEIITSPTFVVLKVYPAKLSNNQKIEFVHIDAYRAETIEDIKSVGIEDYLNRADVVIVIEWPEKIQEILPKNTMKISFKFIGENSREIKAEDKT